MLALNMNSKSTKEPQTGRNSLLISRQGKRGKVCDLVFLTSSGGGVLHHRCPGHYPSPRVKWGGGGGGGGGVVVWLIGYVA